jgi:hypothetical protein
MERSFDFPKNVKCNLCAGAHRTESHQCTVTGCTTAKGRCCATLTSNARTARAHIQGWSKDCPKKQLAIATAREWRISGRGKEPEEEAEPEEEVLATPGAGIGGESQSQRLSGEEGVDVEMGLVPTQKTQEAVASPLTIEEDEEMAGTEVTATFSDSEEDL